MSDSPLVRTSRFLVGTIAAETMWQAAFLYALIGLVIYRHQGLLYWTGLEFAGLILVPLVVSMLCAIRFGLFASNSAQIGIPLCLAIMLGPMLALLGTTFGVILPICKFANFCIDYY